MQPLPSAPATAPASRVKLSVNAELLELEPEVWTYVIAHELLHTLGASDKYAAGGWPVFPHGYAEPDLPQSMPRQQAEILGGRYVNAAGRLVMPASLAQCVIGSMTAHEINFDEGFRRSFAASD